MRITLAIAMIAVVAGLSPADARRKPVDVSWGKHGVSFDDYRRDTLECANLTYGLDVSVKPETVAALSAQNSAALAAVVSGLERKPSADGSYAGGAAGYAAAMATIDPRRVVYRNSGYTELFRHAAYVDVTDQLQAVLNFCLVQRGYARFRLTADQHRQLRRYQPGTEARARYLHRLSAAYSGPDTPR